MIKESGKEGVWLNNSECIEVFKQYLANEKKASANTLSSYLRDIRRSWMQKKKNWQNT